MADSNHALQLDKANKLSEDAREKKWQDDKRTFHDKNVVWNREFLLYIKDKTATGRERRSELIETLRWLGIDIENDEFDDNGLHKGIETFRKNYVPARKSAIEKFADDIVRNCYLTDGSVDLEKSKQRIDLLHDKGFLTIFGGTIETPHIYTSLSMHIAQKRKESMGISKPSDKKHSHKQQALRIASITFSLLFISSLGIGMYTRHNEQRQMHTMQPPQTAGNVLGVETENESLPKQLKIPKINVDATIKGVGVTETGTMKVPENAVDVGWFELGPRPGESGSAVIAGHFDEAYGKAGVFTQLHKLKQGDLIYIKKQNGTSITFIVRESRLYDPGYAQEVFGGSDSTQLNLITCDGVWDGDKKSYSKRLVVFADMLD